MGCEGRGKGLRERRFAQLYFTQRRITKQKNFWFTIWNTSLLTPRTFTFTLFPDSVEKKKGKERNKRNPYLCLWCSCRSHRPARIQRTVRCMVGESDPWDTVSDYSVSEVWDDPFLKEENLYVFISMLCHGMYPFNHLWTFRITKSLLKLHKT